MKLKAALLSFILLTTIISRATNYYWVGGSGNWSDYASHWATTSGGSTFHSQVPTTNDDVFFDANSFTVCELSLSRHITLSLQLKFSI